MKIKDVNKIFSQRKRGFYILCRELSIKESDIDKLWNYVKNELRCSYGNGYNACIYRFTKKGARL